MSIEEIKMNGLFAKDFDKQRLDYWLKKKIPKIPYPLFASSLRKGVVRVNGKRAKNSYLLKEGDIVRFSREINVQ